MAENEEIAAVEDAELDEVAGGANQAARGAVTNQQNQQNRQAGSLSRALRSAVNSARGNQASGGGGIG